MDYSPCTLEVKGAAVNCLSQVRAQVGEHAFALEAEFLRRKRERGTAGLKFSILEKENGMHTKI